MASKSVVIGVFLRIALPVVSAWLISPLWEWGCAVGFGLFCSISHSRGAARAKAAGFSSGRRLQLLDVREQGAFARAPTAL